jgi:hypothetical protein
VTKFEGWAMSVCYRTEECNLSNVDRRRLSRRQGSFRSMEVASDWRCPRGIFTGFAVITAVPLNVTSGQPRHMRFLYNNKNKRSTWVRSKETISQLHVEACKVDTNTKGGDIDEQKSLLTNPPSKMRHSRRIYLINVLSASSSLSIHNLIPHMLLFNSE